VSQIWIYGNSFKRFLVAVVVPDPDTLIPWAKQNKIDGDYKALCANPKVNKAILDSLEKHAKDAKLHGFEYIKAIHLSPVPFSVDNDLMTPTFKLRRPQLLKYYQKEIDAMYLQIGD
jgi:long-chain acyl-CoA synthetase